MLVWTQDYHFQLFCHCRNLTCSISASSLTTVKYLCYKAPLLYSFFLLVPLIISRDAYLVSNVSLTQQQFKHLMMNDVCFPKNTFNLADDSFDKS